MTDDKPHKCAHCAKAFPYRSGLLAHLATHLPYAQRPFVCDHAGCTKRFVDAPSLAHHVQTHRRDRPRLPRGETDILISPLIYGRIVATRPASSLRDCRGCVALKPAFPKMTLSMCDSPAGKDITFNCRLAA